ncbi:hypothetical protein [Acinetobacter sp. TUM15064]|uniref:hypothetical protein n=1 Tax=Acinetobacter sp. TUM15064 TaxID=2609134 RepID=UPI00124F2A49|nr:hypothetical protein [Acinetobacter sp. TUM15064]
MSTETLSILQKRQAIERGLSQYLPGTLLEQVLNHWEAKYGDQPSFVLNRFLSEICTTEELRYHRKDMLRNVLAEMAQVEKQVLLKPTAQELRAEQTQEQLLDAFIFFMQGICQSVKDVDMQDFESEVKVELEALSILMSANQRLDDRMLLNTLLMAQYAQMLTACYEKYCEFYSPAKADQVYASIKRQVKTQYPSVDLHWLI